MYKETRHFRQCVVSFLSYRSLRTENVPAPPGHTNCCLHKNVSKSTVVCLFETFQPSVWSYKVNFSQHFCRSGCSCFKYHPWNWALPSSCAYRPLPPEILSFQQFTVFVSAKYSHWGFQASAKKLLSSSVCLSVCLSQCNIQKICSWVLMNF